ncbi:hypothetical protein QYF36_006082 [Acer negundo]|nr:hypothetical protein QYF36_006082 [Acer negundo]
MGTYCYCAPESTTSRPISYAGSLPSTSCGIDVYPRTGCHSSSNWGRGHRPFLSGKPGIGSGRRWDLDGSEKEDSPKETARMLNRDLDRERAVAEAKMWGENLREKRRQSAQGSFDGKKGS